MARYVVLLSFTPQGSSNLKKSTSRAAAFAKAAEKGGVKVESQLWTLGAYDGVVVLQGEEIRVLQVIASLVAAGNVKTTSLKAFDSDEFRAITS